MGMLRKVALVVVGKKVYDEVKKPHNQRRIRAAVERVRLRRERGSGMRR